MFQWKSKKNRDRVRKCRLLKKLRSVHVNQVRERIYSQRDINIDQHLSSNCEENFCSIDDGKVVGFEHKLRCWAINHRITGSAINDLLIILIYAGFTFLPKDSRTFMGTPSQVPIKVLTNGRMWYNGVKKCLEGVLARISRDVCITLDFNFDGIPIFKSSNLQFWPILAAIRGTFFSNLNIQSY